MQTGFPRISALLAAIALAPAVTAVVPASLVPGQQDTGLQGRVAALESQVASLSQQLTSLTQPLLIDVDCGAGASLRTALAGVQRHPAPVVITVFGLCVENIVVSRGDLLIRAGAPGAGITAAIAGLPAVQSSTLLPPRTFSLAGLAITGGLLAVRVDFGTQVQVIDCTVASNSHVGVLIQHQGVVRFQNSVIENNSVGIQVNHRGLARLENTTVQNNSSSGILAWNSAMVVVTGGALRNNGADGLTLGGSATADVGGNVQIASNGRYGVQVDFSSVLRVNAATISGNVLTGVFVLGGSTVYLEPGATITSNGASGISLMDTSLLQKQRGQADIHITNNVNYGVVCSVPPAVAQVVGFTFQIGDITGNGSGAINCPISPGPFSQ